MSATILLVPLISLACYFLCVVQIWHCIYICIWLQHSLPCSVVFCRVELLRPMARSSSNAAIFAPQSDPSIISFENSISNTNRMYAMRTIGSDCSSQSAWKAWLEGGRQALAAANIPCCLVTGEYDGIFSSESSLRFKEMLGVSDDMYHEIEGVGHLPMVEKGDEVAAILRDFLCNNSGELECVERSSRRSSRSSSEGSERRGGRSSTASNRSSAASSN